MSLLKQSTAVTVKLGPFVDSTDGATAETGLTISQADIRLSKNGAAFAQTNNAAGATHDENGWYGVPLNTTDTNTLGRLTVAVNESGALPVWKDFEIVSAAIYDTFRGALPSLFHAIGFGTAQSGSVSTIQLAAATSFPDDSIIGASVLITGGTGAGQESNIIDWVSATDTGTVSPPFTTAPDNTSTYVLFSAPALPVLPELTGIPAGEVNLAQQSTLIYMAIRNKRVTTPTSDAIYNDAGSAIATAVITAVPNTSVTKGEYS